jgi:hypothetical protein
VGANARYEDNRVNDSTEHDVLVMEGKRYRWDELLGEWVRAYEPAPLSGKTIREALRATRNDETPAPRYRTGGTHSYGSEGVLGVRFAKNEQGKPLEAALPNRDEVRAYLAEQRTKHKSRGKAKRAARAAFWAGRKYPRPNPASQSRGRPVPVSDKE